MNLNKLFPFLRKSQFSNGTFRKLSSSSIKIGVQGAPFDKGQPKMGVAQGPALIRNSGFIEVLQHCGLDIKDYGDIEFDMTRAKMIDLIQNRRAHWKHPTRVGLANKMIYESTKNIIQDGRLCLTLGGDHSITIGTVAASSEIYDDLAVLWVDAHPDLNTMQTSPSGNFHGMTLAFLIKELQVYLEKLHAFQWLKPRLSAKNVGFIGLRDVDPGEKAIMDKLGMTAYSMKEIDEFGIKKVTEMTLDKILGPGRKRRLHVSYDIDSLDDLEVPTTGTPGRYFPVPGGLTLREGITLLEEIRQGSEIVSFDLVEVNPVLGNAAQAKRTSEVTKHLLINAFGSYRGGMASAHGF